MNSKTIISGVLFFYATSLISHPICISLGDGCGPAMMLRDLGLRREAFPFDWTVSYWDAFIRAFTDDFQFFLTDLKMRPGNQGVIDYYGIHFTHDWPTNENPHIDALNADFIGNNELFHSWQQALPLVRQKYARRIERFRNVCRGRDKVIFIRSGDSGADLPTIQNKAIAIRDYLKSQYPTLDFTLVYISGNPVFQEPWNIDRIKNFYDTNWHNPNGLAHMLKQVDPAFNKLRQVSHARIRRSELEFNAGYWLEDEMDLD
jgi:hypothetical protein